MPYSTSHLRQFAAAESVPNGDFEKQDGAALAEWEPGRAIHRLAKIMPGI